MKLLIVTQAVDQEDPVLGFFTRWIEEFAKQVERIEVICLKEGKHMLPANVRVYSLGKEGGVSRVKYILNFYTYIWRLHHDYDTVFVHMNPEYVILGGPLWRLWGKHVAFWYNHPHAGVRFSIAAYLSNVILFTSIYAASAKLTHARQMPAGIDTDVFKPRSIPHNRQSIYVQGRIMPSKRVHIALEALRLLRRTVSAELALVGPEDSVYGRDLRTRFADIIDSGAVVFAGPKNNAETPMLYAAAGVSVNLAAAGHFDKSVLESMACGTPVILSSPAFTGLIPTEWIVRENDSPALAVALLRLMTLPEEEYHMLGEELRAHVIAKHSLAKLGEQLIQVLQ